MIDTDYESNLVAYVAKELTACFTKMCDNPKPHERVPSNILTPSMAAARFEAAFSMVCGSKESPIRVEARMDVPNGRIFVDFYERATGKLIKTEEEVHRIVKESMR